MNVEKAIKLLGRKATDKVTAFKGVITSMSFDLYGCVQALVTPPAKDGKRLEAGWYDLNRLKITPGKPVMEVPNLDFKRDKGPAEKPTK